MFGTQDLFLFMVSGMLLNIIPGPDSIYIMGRGATQGFRAGSSAALGIGAGTFVHIFAAAFGLSAIMATSATAFTAVKIIGAIYLVYIGCTMLLTGSQKDSSTGFTARQTSMVNIFSQGFLTNALNPKVALFFLAFVPQFIDPNAPDKVVAFLFLGLVFNFNGMIWCHFLAWTSSVAGKKVKQNEAIGLWFKRTAGGLFLYFGVKLAFSEQN